MTVVTLLDTLKVFMECDNSIFEFEFELIEFEIFRAPPNDLRIIKCRRFLPLKEKHIKKIG